MMSRLADGKLMSRPTCRPAGIMMCRLNNGKLADLLAGQAGVMISRLADKGLLAETQAVSATG